MSKLFWEFPYPARRMPVLARNVVATSQPLAAQAGIAALRAGGSAADAALAAAITLTVVEPTSNGLGSDAFAIIWDGRELHGLNASGRSPAAWTPERFLGREQMPMRGWDSVTVPGAVSAWTEVSRRFGRLPFGQLFESAIHYAREGFHVSPVTAAAWAEAPGAYAAFPDFARAFLPQGNPPRAGELFRHPEQARTLEEIAASRGDSFYRGSLAAAIAECAQLNGGAMTREDLAAHSADWVGTISMDYHGLRVHEIPPNGQGIAALIALGILKHFPLSGFAPESPDSLHLQIEAMRLAFADIDRHLADPAAMLLPTEDLLAEEYLAGRARAIDPIRASVPTAGIPPPGGTVYLTAADSSGMMVSFIQSNFWGFGSGVVVPGTGISLQNRGYGFTLEHGHPNQVGPHKRPFQTIIPGFVMKDGRPLMSFGVMGGSMQPQGHLQLIVRMTDYGQNPQAALDAPRWRIMPDGRVLVENGIAPEVLRELQRRGHRIEVSDFTAFGGGQAALCLEDGGYLAASDWRKDGQAAGF